MEYNLSGVDINMFFNDNVAVNVSIFLLVVLLPLLLCLLCVLALSFATGINKKVRFLLINIFAAEICNWLSYAVLYLGWPVRQRYDEDNMCKLFISLIIVSAVQKFTGGAIYAINIYISFKYGEDKLKWYVLLPFIALLWILAIAALGDLPYLDEYGAASSNGFCRANPDTALYKAVIGGLVTVAIIFISIQPVFCILTLIYNNKMHEDDPLKKSLTRLLSYVVVSSILSLITNFIPVLNPLITNGAIREKNLVGFLAVNYLSRLLANSVNIPTPIVAIALLKPLRVAIKSMIKAIACSYPIASNAVHPIGEDQ